MIFGESLSKRNQLRPSTTTARGRKTALFVPIELDEGRSTQIELNEGRSRSIEVNECRSRSIELDRVSSSSIKVNRVSSSSIEVNRVSSSSIQMSPNELDRANKKETARPPVPRGSREQLLISFNTTEANQHGTPTDVAIRRACNPDLTPDQQTNHRTATTVSPGPRAQGGGGRGGGGGRSQRRGVSFCPSFESTSMKLIERRAIEFIEVDRVHRPSSTSRGPFHLGLDRPSSTSMGPFHLGVDRPSLTSMGPFHLGLDRPSLSSFENTLTIHPRLLPSLSLPRSPPTSRRTSRRQSASPASPPTAAATTTSTARPRTSFRTRSSRIRSPSLPRRRPT